ncbi:hypothetical protein [Microbacterium sp. NPDC056234]|uniref:hypothetical protein n=1 Tax=Microbacterium sp. NPDC056234 TaxID=3345757 RepID=UPI0035DF3948
MNEQLKSDLASADPIVDRDDAEVGHLVRRIASAAEAATNAKGSARVPWWKRRRSVIPLGVVALVAATGAAVLIPLQLGTEDGAQFSVDAEIPINYTTETGVDISCRYGIYFGDPSNRTAADERLADFVNDHDWTGIGQRIYDEAMSNPFVPGPNDDWQVDTQQLRDKASFSQAATLIWIEIPDELMREGQQSASTTDCKGQLR